MDRKSILEDKLYLAHDRDGWPDPNSILVDLGWPGSTVETDRPVFTIKTRQLGLTIKTNRPRPTTGRADLDPRSRRSSPNSWRPKLTFKTNQIESIIKMDKTKTMTKRDRTGFRINTDGATQANHIVLVD